MTTEASPVLIVSRTGQKPREEYSIHPSYSIYSCSPVFAIALALLLGCQGPVQTESLAPITFKVLETSQGTAENRREVSSTDGKVVLKVVGAVAIGNFSNDWGEVTVWNATNGKPVAQYRGPPYLGEVLGLSFNGDARVLLITSAPAGGK